MADMSCIFCKELKEEADNIFLRSHSGLFAVRWDYFPSTPGHAEVIPTRHVRFLKDFTDEEMAELLFVAQAAVGVIEKTDFLLLYQRLLNDKVNEVSEELIGKAVRRSSIGLGKPDAYNFGINDGLAAGQSIPHAHLHILPRWGGDVTNPRGGIRNMFKNDPYSTL